MFRQVSWSLARLAGRRAAQPAAAAAQTSRMNSTIARSQKDEGDEEFDARYIAYLDRPDIDGWEIRKAMTDLHGMDLVPEPTIIAAGLRACRRVNDFALSVRIMECMHMKCETTDVWPWLLQELQPTLDELGIPTHIELGYDKPELALPSPYEIH